MKLFITGGLGFVGTKLSAALTAQGHRVTVIERNPGNKPAPPQGVSVITADASMPGSWQDAIAGHDAVINLAGVSIFSRWTGQKKDDIYNSRILITRNVADGLKKIRGAKPDLLSASAVGYYGFHGDEMLSENDIPGEDFLASVCRDWETEAMKAADSGSRVVITRFGVILDSGGGALDLLARLFRMRLGNRLGSGRQWFSWIHADDLVAAFLYLLEKRKITGPVNITAPTPVTNRELTKALNRALGTFPLVPPAPGFILKLALGEFGDFLLRGQRAVPRRLLDLWFEFKYPDIEAALTAIFQQNPAR
ncbi:MAG: TIGR01777 family oxidoreductase [Spirochaetes bacterium]|nr:TIGR01777 family oxidoreductase [Spirochaetota bacterium]